MVARPQYSDLDFLSASNIVNLLDPTAPQNPATKNYVDNAIEGLNWKDSVAAATTANINLASPGASFDAYNANVNDRILVMGQTTLTQNGIYIFNGAATAMTRSLDASTSAELNEAVVTVTNGTTNAGATFRQTTVNPTVGTSNVAWATFGTSVPQATTATAGKVQLAQSSDINSNDASKAVTGSALAGSNYAKLKYATTFGDGASTSYTITHNLGTLDIINEIYEVGSPYRKVDAVVEHTSTNTLTILTSVAPASNSLRIVVIG